MAKSTRIEALDVLRGITVAAMILFNNPGSWGAQYAPLKHAEWNGLTPTDLAYPFFMFVMGVSAFLSLEKLRGNHRAALAKIIKRSVLLYAVGIFLVSFGPLVKGTFAFETVRLLGVLQRLALAYLFGAIFIHFAPQKAILPKAGILLLFYVVIMQLFGGYAHDSSNLVSRIDLLVLGEGHMYQWGEVGTDGKFPFEPEGLLSTIPSIAHVLLGAYAGSILRGTDTASDKIRRIAVFGFCLLAIGFLLSWGDPINKKLWTSSFTLVTCGAASLMLATLMEIIDLRGHDSWVMPAKVFGTNALVAYALSSMMATLIAKWEWRKYVYQYAIYPAFEWAGPQFCSLVWALLFVVFIWLLTLPLYRKNIFIKL